jgi:hypothetical protein
MKRIAKPTEEMPDDYRAMTDVKPIETKDYLSSEVPPKEIFNHNLKHLKSFKNIRTAYKNKNLKYTFVNDLSIVLKEYDPTDPSNELNDELLLEIMNISEEYFICKCKTTREELKTESVKSLMLPYFRNDEKLLDKTISHIYHKVKKSSVIKRVWKRFTFFFVRT